MPTTEELLQQGIAAARAGQREEARTLLMQVVEADERNEQAWLWLAGVVDDPEDMRTCLENVLDLNPGNIKAQQGLAWIEARHGQRAAPAPGPGAAPDAPPDAATGPTTKLASEAAAATMAATVAPPPPAAPAPAEAAAPPDNPCPYCGAPTTPTQRYCTQCRNSLMIRTAPREQRSVATTILAVLWAISTALTILGGLAYIALGFLGGALLQSAGRQAGRGGAALTAALLIPGIIILIFGGLSFVVTRGLFRQARWAYIVHLVLLVLGTIGAVINVVQGGAILAMLARPPSGQLPPNQAQVAAMAGTIVSVALFCAVVWQLIYIALTVLSWRDFFGPNVRFLPEVDVADHLGHYNNGVAYKNRGMWYMAAREWEAAVSKAPHDLNYLHALGLAYAQIKQFAKARTTLDRALEIAPADPRIQDSRALVDKLAARQR
jgi:tetratricopeptide (TPR) repeat protein